jgi:hypothetical protein
MAVGVRKGVLKMLRYATLTNNEEMTPINDHGSKDAQ